MASSAPWARKVTGFLPAAEVGQILAVSDAVVFPFAEGAGDWNTSVKVAEAAGIFTIATTKDSSLLGCHEENNMFFTSCDNISAMRVALSLNLGRRVKPRITNEWERITTAHERIYRSLCT